MKITDDMFNDAVKAGVEQAMKECELTIGMKNKELLPCPFCGGEAECRYMEAYGMRIVHCLSCGARTGLYKTSWKAEEKWNTRTNTIPVGNGENYEVTHE